MVVDLFARLRAEAVTIEPVDDIEPDLDAAPDAAAPVDAAPVDAVVVLDVEVVESPEIDDASTGDETVESTPFEQRDADLTPLIVSAARKLKRVLADEQNEVLEALRRNEPVRALDALLPSVGDHVARYGGAISDDLLGAAQAGAATGRTNGLGSAAQGRCGRGDEGGRRRARRVARRAVA